MTGNVTIDIDSIYDMVNYVSACTDRLVEEWQTQDLGITDEYTEMISLRTHMQAAKEYIHRVRNWREPERVFGPCRNLNVTNYGDI